MPLAKNRQRHGRNRGTGGATDRAFCKKTTKARSKPWGSGHARPCLLQKMPKARSKPQGSRCNRPCLLQKIVKGTVEIVGQAAQPTVPFTKNRQRHGRNRPCLLQKIGKGTVEMAGQQAQSTVPFAKNHQRHGRNCREAVVTDRAFCQKSPKARSKPRYRRRN